MIKIDWFGDSHIGKVRQSNQDYYIGCPQEGVWIVCDGMGGHDYGDIPRALWQLKRLLHWLRMGMIWKPFWFCLGIWFCDKPEKLLDNHRRGQYESTPDC